MRDKMQTGGQTGAMKEYHEAVCDASQGVERFLTRTFSEIIIDGPPVGPEIFDDAATTITCTHRSQADYFILGAFLNQSGVKNLRFAAGDNLTQLPIIGKKFRDFGAFSVHRGKSFGKRYVRDLCRQVMQMIRDGDNIIVFPEAGRSYSGQMLEVKNGILSAQIIDAYKNPERKHLVFPVAISYEHLPELRYFEMLQRGKALRQKRGGLLHKIRGNFYYYGADAVAFSKFFFANKFGKHYGRVYIDHAAPFEISGIIDLKHNVDTEARDWFSAHRKSMQKTREFIHKQFLTLYRLQPMHVLARCLKEHEGSLTHRDFLRSVPGILDGFHERELNTRTLDALSPGDMLREGIRQLTLFEAVHAGRSEINVRNRPIVDYYAAATISQRNGV